MIGAMLVGIIIGVLIVGAVIADAQGDVPMRDAEGIAQCISEYDYTHPRGNKYENLVRAIRWCNVGDRATARECVAPCIVKLPKGTLEDQFGFDYGWVDKSHPIIRVWVKGGR